MGVTVSSPALEPKRFVYGEPFEPGSSSPLGVSLAPAGANFCLFSRHASKVELLLFDHDDDKHPARVIRLDPFFNRTYHYWHVFVHGIEPGQIYGFRIDGAFDPQSGLQEERTAWQPH